MRSLLLLSLVIASVDKYSDAATIVQTESFAGIPAYATALTFQQFDGSLGTLDSVFFEANITSHSGQLRLDNDAPTPSSGVVSYGSDALITSNEVSLLNGSFQPVIPKLEVMSSGFLLLDADDGDGGVFSLVGSDSGILASSSGSDYESGQINPFFFSQFTGNSTFEINAETGQVIDFGAIGGVQFQGDPIVTNGFVRVTYHYSPVPSPSTLAGMYSLMLVLGSQVFFRKRFRQRNRRSARPSQ